MNSQINTLRVFGFVEDQIHAAAEARGLPEYRRESSSRERHVAARRRFPRLNLKRA